MSVSWLPFQDYYLQYILYTRKQEASSSHTWKDFKAHVVAFVEPVQVSDTSDNVRAGCFADVSC